MFFLSVEACFYMSDFVVLVIDYGGVIRSNNCSQIILELSKQYKERITVVTIM